MFWWILLLIIIVIYLANKYFPNPSPRNDFKGASPNQLIEVGNNYFNKVRDYQKSKIANVEDKISGKKEATKFEDKETLEEILKSKRDSLKDLEDIEKKFI